MLVFNFKSVPVLEGIRNSDLFLLNEGKNVFDCRHIEQPDAKNSRFFKGESVYDYISPTEGFYWDYYKGDLILSSTSNFFYSSEVAGIVQKEDRAKISKLWNNLGGKVVFQQKTIVFNKDNYGNGKLRQKQVYDIKELKKALKDLFVFGLTKDFKIKGLDSFQVGKTVKDALSLKDPTDEILKLNQNLIFYHGTSFLRWEDIKHEGLKPNQTGDCYADLIPNYSDLNIYLSFSPKASEFYAKRQAKKDETDGVVLRIEGVDTAKILADDGSLYPPEYLNKTFQEIEKIASSSRKMVWSGRKKGEFAYRGIILPSHISLFKTIKVSFSSVIG